MGSADPVSVNPACRVVAEIAPERGAAPARPAGPVFAAPAASFSPAPRADAIPSRPGPSGPVCVLSSTLNRRSLPPVLLRCSVRCAVWPVSSVTDSDSGETWATGGISPTPDSGTISVDWSGSLLVIVSEPLRSPGVAGVNTTGTLLLENGPMVRL